MLALLYALEQGLKTACEPSRSSNMVNGMARDCLKKKWCVFNAHRSQLPARVVEGRCYSARY